MTKFVGITYNKIFFFGHSFRSDNDGSGGGKDVKGSFLFDVSMTRAEKFQIAPADEKKSKTT